MTGWLCLLLCHRLHMWPQSFLENCPYNKLITRGCTQVLISVWNRKLRLFSDPAYMGTKSPIKSGNKRTIGAELPVFCVNGFWFLRLSSNQIRDKWTRRSMWPTGLTQVTTLITFDNWCFTGHLNVLLLSFSFPQVLLFLGKNRFIYLFIIIMFSWISPAQALHCTFLQESKHFLLITQDFCCCYALFYYCL